jgi:hypothetical protein
MPESKIYSRKDHSSKKSNKNVYVRVELILVILISHEKFLKYKLILISVVDPELDLKLNINNPEN